ncbi:MAG: glycosyltransferase family 4 protein [Chloroflexota bacterium]|nr:glycosyltransferase family 4 protein [Chloroflexota bacterium]
MREATALAEAGFTVSIVDVERERSLPDEETISGIHVKHIIRPDWFTSPRFTPWILIRTLQKIIVSTRQLLRTPAAVYHAHDLTALPACYIAAQLHRASLIFDAHELPLHELNGSLWYRFRKLFASILTLLISRCASVITVSPPIAREIRTRYHPPAVSLVRNIPAYQTVPQSDRLRQRLKLGKGARIVLYQGNIQPNRSLEMLVHAAPFLEPDTVIVLMGWASDVDREQLAALIERKGVGERVKILPPVPYKDLLHWTASADIGLVIFSPDYSLNIRWCLPNKLFEYLMAGLPVLASPLDAVADVLNAYAVGQVVSSLAPADIATAINSMLADRVVLERMHQNAQQAVQRDLCWEKERQNLLELYQNLIR